MVNKVDFHHNNHRKHIMRAD